MRKCLICNGCCEYEYIENHLFLHCAFCNVYYYKRQDGKLIKIKNLTTFVEQLNSGTVDWKIENE